MKKLYVFILGFFFIGSISAQSTFSEVYNLLQAKCATSGCHGATNTSVYSLDGTQNDVYNVLVGIVPENTTAAAKGYKRVDPGYPSRSFLLRKIAHGLSQDLHLEQPLEGESMPKGGAKLDDADIELVRQWILAGAPKNGTVIDKQLLIDYYNGQGTKKITPLTPPAANEGMQLYEGPHFVSQGDESEFLHKVHLKLPDSVEVYRIDVKMHRFSHHMILYKYKPNGHQSVPEGARELTSIFGQFDVNVNADNIGTWQFDRNLVLPEGTAYFWDEETRIDVNYHIPNYSQDSILAAEVYINIYYRPKQTGTVEMHAALAVYGGFNPYQLNIPNTGQEITLSFPQTLTGQTFYFWTLQAHTHELGTDYDIYLREPNGSRGDQIYEGFYNVDYRFEQGYYDWEHPAIRTFDPFLEVDMSKGLIHEAKYLNDGPAPVGFGLTSKDEMFITYYQYTTELPPSTDVSDKPALDKTNLRIFPNPTKDAVNIQYDLTKPGDVKLEVFNLLGSSLKTIAESPQEQGRYNYQLNLNDFGLSSGVYLLKLSVDGSSFTRKVMQVE